jgi:hypothetical protein
MAGGSSRQMIYATEKELNSSGIAGDRIMEGWIGVKVMLKKPETDKILKAMAASKKSAELWAAFDGKKVTVEMRVGTSFKQPLGTLDIEGEKDIEKRRELLKKINAKDKKLFSDQDLYKFNNDHPEKATVDDARGQVTALKPEIEKLHAKVTLLKNLTFDHCGSAELSREFSEWVEKKHWGLYLDFLHDVDAGGDSKKIYDTYIGDGKQQVAKPVNLDAATAGKIKQALDAGKVPDFAVARAQILKVVDSKFVPEFKKETLPALEKELKHKEEYLGELNALLAKK